ncbi:hypothetical protein Tco_0808885 [Tanacetum coccineum]
MKKRSRVRWSQRNRNVIESGLDREVAGLGSEAEGLWVREVRVGRSSDRSMDGLGRLGEEVEREREEAEEGLEERFRVEVHKPQTRGRRGFKEGEGRGESEVSEAKGGQEMLARRLRGRRRWLKRLRVKGIRERVSVRRLRFDSEGSYEQTGGGGSEQRCVERLEKSRTREELVRFGKSSTGRGGAGDERVKVRRMEALGEEERLGLVAEERLRRER